MEKEINVHSIEEIAYQAWIHDKSLGRMERGETMPYVFNLFIFLKPCISHGNYLMRSRRT
ncbi:hypothetical protein GCM10008986_09770 [Salinibacillus aidingensis]|uniref:XRE family transcriptional regulator n=1 Tax=Salinibacillus aidingensis TaxID=237684 RepID=A0ABN1AYE4_9BACI